MIFFELMIIGLVGAVLSLIFKDVNRPYLRRNNIVDVVCLLFALTSLVGVIGWAYLAISGK